MTDRKRETKTESERQRCLLGYIYSSQRPQLSKILMDYGQKETTAIYSVLIMYQPYCSSNTYSPHIKSLR